MPAKRLSRRVLLATALWAAAAGAEAAPPALPLGPGTVTGQVHPYVVRPGDRLETVAPAFGVNPVRITTPSAGALKDGLEAGETIFVDQRRIQPRFAPWVDGLVLNVPEAEVYQVSAGRLVKSYPVAVSQTDWKVPIGQFEVVAMQVNPTWHVPPKIQAEMARKGEPVKQEVKPGPENPLGPRWIGFADGTYGFHGTIEPGSIKHYASHGCVRFLNPDIKELYGRVKLGTPVRVYYQPVLLAVDHDVVWLSAYPDVYRKDVDYQAAAHALIDQAGVKERINPAALARVLARRDGIVYDISRPSEDGRPSTPPGSSR